MRILLISILVLFAMQSKASVSDTLTDNGLTEMRINDYENKYKPRKISVCFYIASFRRNFRHVY